MPLPAANLLRDTTSPYLLQHADNPVHWRPWGPEALAEAVEALRRDPDNAEAQDVLRVTGALQARGFRQDTDAGNK